jgi:hypothetical protein
MDFNTTPPSFNLKYDIGTVPDIGAGYAKGITAAGESLAGATKGVFDVMARNQNANDMLSAMKQNKVLTPDQYNSIATKSLGAKEQMTGMYANQWILDQANQRAISLAKGQGGVDVAVAHAKALDQIQAGRSGAAGVNKMPYTGAPPQQPVQQQQQPVQQPAGTQTTAGAPWAPGTKAVQVKDTKTGNLINAVQLPNGELHDQSGNLLQ